MKIRSKITLLCLRENDGKVRFKIATKVTGGVVGHGDNMVSSWKLQFSGILLNCFLFICKICNLCSSLRFLFSSFYFPLTIFSKEDQSYYITHNWKNYFWCSSSFLRGVLCQLTRTNSVCVILRHFLHFQYSNVLDSYHIITESFCIFNPSHGRSSLCSTREKNNSYSFLWSALYLFCSSSFFLQD